MARDLHTQIYNSFNREETETLIEIWETNNRSEWSDLAFEVLERVLLERLLELPPQKETEHEQENKKIEKNLFDKVKEWFAEDDEKNEYPHDWGDENVPAFYDPQEVLKIYQWLNKLAKTMVPISILLGLITFPQTLDIAQSYFINSYRDMTIIIWLFALITMAVGVALQMAVTYYPLKALAYILKILMQFEHNSRK